MASVNTLNKYLEAKIGHQRLAAIVLRKAASGEADLVVTFLTRELGLVSALAKNARKSRRRFGGGLLEPGMAAWYFFRFKPARDLALVEKGESIDCEAPPQNPLVYALATFALELVAAFEAPHNPAQESFTLLLKHLKRLKSAENNLYEARCCSLSFCLKYLELAGFAPHFDSCLICGRVPQMTEKWLWEAKGGGLYCPDCFHSVGPNLGAAPVPENLLIRLCGGLPGRCFAEEDLIAAELFFEKMAGHASGRKFKSLEIFRKLLKN